MVSERSSKLFHIFLVGNHKSSLSFGQPSSSSALPWNSVFYTDVHNFFHCEHDLLLLMVSCILPSCSERSREAAFSLPPNIEHLCQCWERSIMSSCITAWDWGLLGRQVAIKVLWAWWAWMSTGLSGRLPRARPSLGMYSIPPVICSEWTCDTSLALGQSCSVGSWHLLCAGVTRVGSDFKTWGSTHCAFPLLLMDEWNQRRAGISCFTTRWW